jgi:hypothetical protein
MPIVNILNQLAHEVERAQTLALLSKGATKKRAQRYAKQCLQACFTLAPFDFPEMTDAELLQALHGPNKEMIK